jgi:hypothetical protein
MVRPSGVILLVLLSGPLAVDAPGDRTGLASNLCTITLTQVIRIPVRTLGTLDTAESLNAAPATLMIWPGAADAPAEGPAGFDVLNDGSLLITDPLRSNVSSFDPHGRFLKAWKIGFATDSLTVIANGLVLAREASTGRMHAFDQEGETRTAEGVTPPERDEAHVLAGQNRGTIMRPASENAHGGPLEVQLDKPGLTLLSLESLATDQNGDTYVALETTTNGEATEAISLNKYVRRYSALGKLLCEIANIPLDYYVTPVDELRVHKGVVYQLQTTRSEVRVNVWDTNQLCSRPSR